MTIAFVSEPFSIDSRRLSRHALVAAALLASCAPALARTPRVPRAASSPSTESILAHVRAIAPDDLPTDPSVYRCGNSYSATPCADAKPLNVRDDRSDAQRVQAEDVAQRDRRLAAWYAAQRIGQDTPASAPRKVRARTSGCVQSASVACPPRQPRPRRAIGKPTAPASAAPKAVR